MHCDKFVPLWIKLQLFVQKIIIFIPGKDWLNMDRSSKFKYYFQDVGVLSLDMLFH